MNPRELRMLKILSENNKVTVKDLRSLVGCLNPAQVKLTLLKKGWHIKTAYFPIKDRDGKICFPGFYSMEPLEQERARIMIEKTKGATAITPSVIDINEQTSQQTSKFNNNKGGKNGNSSL